MDYSFINTKGKLCATCKEDINSKIWLTYEKKFYHLACLPKEFLTEIQKRRKGKY